MKIMICTGGTAGHLFPAIALAQELEEASQKVAGGIEILFIGTTRDVEQKILSSYKYNFDTIPSIPLKRKLSADLFKFIWVLLKSLFASLKIVRKFSPDVVVGMGGYGSFAPILASAVLSKKRIIHEQNSVPGLANRALARLSNKIAISHKTSARYFANPQKTVYTGNPVRKNILKVTTRKEAAESIGVRSDLKTVLVFGGSQGAKRINEAVYGSLDELISLKIQVIHLTGKDNSISMPENLLYKRFDFYDDMSAMYAVSDLVICRAGATSIAELTALGKPSILVPYPYATDNHQEKNARILENIGACEIVPDNELNSKQLVEKIKELINNDEKLEIMSKAAKEYGEPEAARQLMELVIYNGQNNR